MIPIKGRQNQLDSYAEEIIEVEPHRGPSNEWAGS